MEKKSEEKGEHKSVKILNPEVARKIAAGEVIDRPSAIVRELMDNAVDSGATKIDVEIYDGGIEKIRVVDNGSGMLKEDLETCARPHATSKISTAEDLLNLSTLGFRGEALSSMAAVSRLEIISGGWKMNASVTENHILTPCSLTSGTIVKTSRLFENFPARRVFLKRSSSEALMCKSVFDEKVLPRPDIEFSFSQDSEKKISLEATNSLKQRFVQTYEFFESEDLFYEILGESSDKTWKFNLVIGEPAVNRTNRKNIFIYVNGRKIQEYSLIQAIEYGATGYFPNGMHPIACLFVEMEPSLVDFNIHPAKKEARFKDLSSLHHGVSESVKNFFKQYTLKNFVQENNDFSSLQTDFFGENSSKNLGENKTDFSKLKNKNLAKQAIETDENENDETKTYSNEIDDFVESTFYKTENSLNSKNFSEVKSKVALEDESPFTKNFGTIKEFESKMEGEEQKYFVNHKSPKSINSYNDRRANFISSFSNFAVENENDENFTKDAKLNAGISGKITKENYLQNQNSKDEDGFRFVGSCLGTFLIAEKNDVLYIIDQHAAHERIIYNHLMEKSGEKQNLLIPYVIETSSTQDDNWIQEIQENLNDSGFTCKKLGEGKWEFTTVPIRWKGNEASLAHDILDKRINPKDILHSVLASTACRSAVMDGTVLDEKTAANLAKQALLLEDPHCPHGRPVFTKITKRQLFELVKRL